MAYEANSVLVIQGQMLFYHLPWQHSGKESACQSRHGTQVRSLDREDPLEKGMATQSSILVWKIPLIEEPCGLESMGSQRVRYN